MNAPLKTIVRKLRILIHYSLEESLIKVFLDRDYNAERHYNAINTVLWFAHGIASPKPNK